MRTLVFTYGRFNPPHLGHQKLLDELQELQEMFGAEKSVVGVSRRFNQINPLSPEDKLELLRSWFPKSSFVLDPNLPSDPISMLVAAAGGYERVVLRLGSDRLAQYARWLSEAALAGEISVNRMVYVVESRLESGPSGTKMRSLAVDGKLEEFSSFLPNQGRAGAAALMEKIRAGVQQFPNSEMM